MIIKLAFAFGAGFISFLTPCVLPIIPGYISYITGKNLNEIERDKKVVLVKTILFSLGFSLVFIVLGVTVSTVGNILLFFSNELRVAAGIIIIKEAGGFVTDFRGENEYIQNKTILVTNSKINNEMIEVLK